MKTTTIISVAISMLIAFSSCEKDNMAGPDAAFFGAVKDASGGALIEQDMLNGSSIEVYEHGYEKPKAMFWDFKVNGEFRNNMVFANTYDLYLRNGNFFPITELDFDIKPGDNSHDFLAVPYLRVLDGKIDRDKTNNKITASFRIEGGKNTVKLKSIALYAWSDIYVGNPFKFDINGGEDTQTFETSIHPNANITYHLSIDLTSNASQLVSGRNYYFRIGALADVSEMGSVKYNYAPAVKISL